VGQIEGTVALLAELKAAGLPCFALSNMEPDSYAIRRDRYAFMRWFDDSVISGIEGIAKPDPRIFQALLGGTVSTGAGPSSSMTPPPTWRRPGRPA